MVINTSDLLIENEKNSLESLCKEIGTTIPVVENIEVDPFGVEIRHGHVVALSLPNITLQKFPQSLFQFSKLEKLYLVNNHLWEIPNEIERLSELRVLGCWGNLLTSLPETIGNLQNLEILLLPENRISDLPQEFEKLKKLKTLGLWKNNVKKIPVSLRGLTSLETLKFNENNIEEIPPWLGKLQSLKILDLSDNSISTLPYSIVQLRNLVEFNLSGNPIDDLPPLEGLDHLETLYLNGTNLTQLDLEGLPKLKCLFLNDSEIQWINGLAHCYSLRKINLSNCRFGQNPTIPLSVEEIDLSWNDLKEIPSDVLKLENLRVLDLHSNNIASLPEKLASQKGLYFLDLSDNSLEGDLEILASFANLEFLLLKGNKIKEFPTSICHLKWLQKLDLSYNEISAIPPVIGNLLSLETLILRKTKIQNLPLEIINLDNLSYLDLSFTPYLPFEMIYEEREEVKELFYDLSADVMDDPNEKRENARIRKMVQQLLESLKEENQLLLFSELWEKFNSLDDTPNKAIKKHDRLNIFASYIADSKFYQSRLLRMELERLDHDLFVSELRNKIWNQMNLLLDMEEAKHTFQIDFNRSFRKTLEKEIALNADRLTLDKESGLIMIRSIDINNQQTSSFNSISPTYACRFCGFVMQKGDIECNRCWTPSLCKKCGSSLPTGLDACPNCNTPIVHSKCGLNIPVGAINCNHCDEEIKYCYRCGQSILHNLLFCSHCQEPVGYCSICRQPFRYKERVSFCPVCQSPFHYTHFYEVIRLNGKCPLCRSSVLMHEIKERFWK
ncbi:MAG: hypothetical protein D6732_11955 [Methanobacteriota archaeon]|nr:MAG: hypothetical protein D6732_11955 [Euryarchaeota archaeon]